MLTNDALAAIAARSSGLGLSRRAFLASLGRGVGTLGLASYLATTDAFGAPAVRPHFPARAKHVIFLFMSGGPSHLDTFDPKPMVKQFEGQRPAEVQLQTERTTGGLYPSPFPFRPGGKSGIPVSDLLPRIRACIDDICVIRSLYSFSPNHQPAVNFMASGRIDASHPTLGAWVSYGLGTENQNLPGFVALGGVDHRLIRNGFLPGEHQGTPVDVQSAAPEQMIAHLRNPKLSRQQQGWQLDFLRQMNQAHRQARGEDALLDARIRAMETAFRMQFTAGEVFDIRKEPPAVRDAYGEGPFATICLLARRLIENGVRFVQIDRGGWDHHTNINVNIPKLCRSIDQPIAALITDLKRRGLFEETLLVWGGEFGRTPVSESQDGRDHNSYGFTMWLAGGGVKGGLAYGATDDFGFRAVENRLSVHDLHATILHVLGIDHEQLTYRYSGRDVRLTDVHGRVVQEILA
jgi:hypothetical protein